jgi:hypothetical protein
MTKAYEKIEVNWGNGTPVQSYPISAVDNITYTYAAIPGDYTVQVKGAFNVNVGCITETNQQLIPVRAKDKPSISTLTSTGTGATIDVQGTTGDVMELWQKTGGTYQPTGQTAMTGASISVMSSGSASQCFQLRVKDGCPTDQSDEVCTLNLTAQAGNKQNTLAWQAYQGTGIPFIYQLRRTDNGAPGSPTPIPGATSKTTC